MIAGKAARALQSVSAPSRRIQGNRSLRLDGTGASDLTPLSPLTELRTLSLSDNGIADLSPLQTLLKLSVMHLGANRGQNQIADIAALAELPTLDYLDLRGNPLDADALSVHIPALEERGVQVLY